MPTWREVVFPPTPEVAGAIRVTLTKWELIDAADVGVLRHAEALIAGRVPTIETTEPKDWQAHIEGAIGELALAKALGVYWPPTVNTFREGGDVGKIQVRTRSEGHFELFVRKKDRDADTFVLVRGRSPNFEVVGYLTGKEAKQEAWLQDHGGYGPAYFVPTEKLRPVHLLADAIRADPTLFA